MKHFSPKLLIKALLWLTASAPLLADPSLPVNPTDNAENKVAPESESSLKLTPAVRKITQDIYQIGSIQLNKRTREISFKATTNIVNQDSILEYLIVRKEGEKVHESLLLTEADPQNLNIALKLLGYKESKELFRVPKPNGTPSEKYFAVADDIKKAARFDIYFTTLKDGEKTTFPASNWVFHRVLKKEMPHKAWIYNGSYIHDQKFQASLSGNFFAIFTDYGSIGNYSGEDRHDDTLWFPHRNVPAEGTHLTVTIKPWDS